MGREDREYRKRMGSPSAEDFAGWEARARLLTDAELDKARQDAGRLAIMLDKVPGGDPAAGWYRDEMASYHMEQTRRRTHRVPRKDIQALNLIADLLSREGSTAGAAVAIADIVRGTGREVAA